MDFLKQAAATREVSDGFLDVQLEVNLALFKSRLGESPM